MTQKVCICFFTIYYSIKRQYENIVIYFFANILSMFPPLVTNVQIIIFILLISINDVSICQLLELLIFMTC